jgi:DNA (cytosine-5)-methyltransferase 1
MTAYYNEIDHYAAAWLRNLIAAGHIAPGDVDERSIADVSGSSLSAYQQCHFFAGIGGWSYALRLAGWPDDRPVWTGSCPCQPFSSAGKRRGTDDPRHLWPEWFRLIRQCRPATIFGEQVASPDGLAWFDAVSADLEREGYAVGAADLCAAGVGAPHQRQRLYFVADDPIARRQGRITQEDGWSASEPRRLRDAGFVADAVSAGRSEGRPGAGHGQITRMRRPIGLGDPCVPGLARRSSEQGHDGSQRATAERASGDAGGMADADVCIPRDGCVQRGRRVLQPAEDPLAGFWRGAEWIYCRDDRWRPVEPGTFPLGTRLPARVGRLRAYGNSIVPQVAAEFVRAFVSASDEGKVGG